MDLLTLFHGSNIVLTPLMGAVAYVLYRLDKRMSAIETIIGLMRADMRLTLAQRIRNHHDT